MNFEYPEDEEFFAKILCDGDIELFRQNFNDYFDFRDPLIKTREFKLIRNKVYEDLVKKYDGKCQLQIPGKCKTDKDFEIDHIIPLSSNQLNKEIRELKGVPGKKTATQSFGSNNKENLILACHACNGFKKNKIIPFRKTTNGIRFL